MTDRTTIFQLSDMHFGLADDRDPGVRINAMRSLGGFGTVFAIDAKAGCILWTFVAEGGVRGGGDERAAGAVPPLVGTIERSFLSTRCCCAASRHQPFGCRRWRTSCAAVSRDMRGRVVSRGAASRCGQLTPDRVGTAPSGANGRRTPRAGGA